MTRWIVAVIIVAAVSIGVIVVVAPGSDSDSEASAAQGPDPEAMTAFRECMTEHGADLPEPPSGELPAPGTGSPPSGDSQEIPPERGALVQPDAETQAALDACADLMPEGQGGFIGPGGPPGVAPIPQD